MNPFKSMDLNAGKLLKKLQVYDKIIKKLPCKSHLFRLFFAYDASGQSNTHLYVGIEPQPDTAGAMFLKQMVSLFDFPPQKESFCFWADLENLIDYLKGAKKGSSVSLERSGDFWYLTQWDRPPFTASKQIDQIPSLHQSKSTRFRVQEEGFEVLKAAALVSQKKGYKPVHRDCVLLEEKYGIVYAYNATRIVYAYNPTRERSYKGDLCLGSLSKKGAGQDSLYSPLKAYIPTSFILPFSKVQSVTLLEEDDHEDLHLHILCRGDEGMTRISFPPVNLEAVENKFLTEFPRIEHSIDYHTQNLARERILREISKASLTKAIEAIEPLCVPMKVTSTGKKTLVCNLFVDALTGYAGLSHKYQEGLALSDRSGVVSILNGMPLPCSPERNAVRQEYQGKDAQQFSEIKQIPLALDDLKKLLEMHPADTFNLEVSSRYSPVVWQLYGTQTMFLMMPFSRYPQGE